MSEESLLVQRLLLKESAEAGVIALGVEEKPNFWGEPKPSLGLVNRFNRGRNFRSSDFAGELKFNFSIEWVVV